MLIVKNLETETYLSIAQYDFISMHIYTHVFSYNPDVNLYISKTFYIKHKSICHNFFNAPKK